MNKEMLGPVWSILVINYATFSVSCCALWQWAEQGADLSGWTLQAGMWLNNVFKWGRRAISKFSRQSWGSSWASDNLLMPSLSAWVWMSSIGLFITEFTPHFPVLLEQLSGFVFLLEMQMLRCICCQLTERKKNYFRRKKSNKQA